MEAELILLFGLIVTVLWLVIGWRAMRAHEKLADQAKRVNDRLAQLDVGDQRKPLREQNRLYKEFLRSHPEMEGVTSKERHERFREWEIEQSD